MEPIELSIRDTEFILMPMPDGSFEVFIETDLLGNIRPQIQDDTTIKWVTLDFDIELAQDIGEALENREN